MLQVSRWFECETLSKHVYWIVWTSSLLCLANYLAHTQTHTHACMHTCTHNRKLPPSFNESMQITKMQIHKVSSAVCWCILRKTGQKLDNESILFNLDRQTNSLIPTLVAFPAQCPASFHSAIPLLHPLPPGLKPQVQANANHWVENARWQHSGVFVIGQWTMREFPEPLVVLMEQLDTNTRHGSGWEETMRNNRGLKTKMGFINA